MAVSNFFRAHHHIDVCADMNNCYVIARKCSLLGSLPETATVLFRLYLSCNLSVLWKYFHECFILLLCQYHKQTDIYYSTWCFETIAKICQFQFLDPPQKHTH